MSSFSCVFRQRFLQIYGVQFSVHVFFIECTGKSSIFRKKCKCLATDITFRSGVARYPCHPWSYAYVMEVGSTQRMRQYGGGHHKNMNTKRAMVGREGGLRGLPLERKNWES